MTETTQLGTKNNGLGDRLSVNGVHYTLDINSGLTQVLADGTNTYTYGLGRISQTNTSTEYFLGDALGSVRQLTAGNGDVTLTKSYDPYGVITTAGGTSQTVYGFTGEYQGDSTELIYLRARYYNPADGRFQSRDTWEGDYNLSQTLNRWNYTESNPINAIDPSGYITEGQADSAKVILDKLKTYNVYIAKDWGYIPVEADPASLPPFIMTEILYDHCEWQAGKWSLNELTMVLRTVKRANEQMLGRFNMLIRPVKVVMTDYSPCFFSDWRGCTSSSGNEIRLKDIGKPAISPDINFQNFKNSGVNFDILTLIHEFGHAWDQQNGEALSTGLMTFTGGHYIVRGPGAPLKCHVTDVPGKDDLNYKKPGCNNARYYYGGTPAYGAGQGFDAREDFANSFAAYIFPAFTYRVIEEKYNDPRKVEEYKLHNYLYYSDYRQEPRWAYIGSLITTGYSHGGGR